MSNNLFSHLAQAGNGNAVKPTWDCRTTVWCLNGYKLKEKIKLDIRKIFFTVGVMRPWYRLPREAVDAPALAGFKARLDENFDLIQAVPASGRMRWDQVIF